MAEGGPQKSLTEMVEQINANPDYKVLTKAEYESLLALASHKPKASGDKEVPVTSTPQANQTVDLGTKPKFTFPNPGVSPVPRLQQILNASRPFNTTYAAQSYQVPKLPFFSGSEEPQKGETTYEVWNFEVKCLQNAHIHDEHIILQSMRNSLKGSARAMLVPLGENAKIEDILTKLDGFYGNVATGETLIQSFYGDFQKDTESIVAYGSRLEQTLSRAIRYGHIDLVAKDAMLRSKFWTGLKSQELKNSTRHLYDSVKDFQLLLRDIRKVEQEIESSKRPVQNPKVAQQQSGQAQTDNSDMLSKQMSELMSKMKALEQKLESQQESLQKQNLSATGQTYSPVDRSQFQTGRGAGYRRGQWRGNSYGRGYNNKGNYQYNSRPGYKGGGSRGGFRGGSNGRGANQGDNSSGANQPLN